MTQKRESIVPPRLRAGDCVRLVSPASTPTPEWVAKITATLENLGLVVQCGAHVLDEWGYMAGRDEDRLADINEAFRDPQVKAVITTRGGKGAYRIADKLDFESIRKHPKLLLGFSEITILHLALWKHCGLASVHGAVWDESFGSQTALSFRRSILSNEPVIITAQNNEPTAGLTTDGTAKGILLGGNQDMIATAAGWGLPSLEGAILLLEDVDKRLGFIDRQLTMLQNGGHLKDIAGVAVGQYEQCGADDTTQGTWTAIDVLRDRLGSLNVPILGGLPLGHGKNPRAVPIGTRAVLDTAAKTLTVDAGVR
ncbi:MAG TPA: LD-carboxypeptidase [Candidatus Saccharimonadales bacterium]|nr:LD-carboxypeptidase [Candidatus Saccharimonadales bacterium]